MPWATTPKSKSKAKSSARSSAKSSATQPSFAPIAAIRRRWNRFVDAAREAVAKPQEVRRRLKEKVDQAKDWMHDRAEELIAWLISAVFNIAFGGALFLALVWALTLEPYSLYLAEVADETLERADALAAADGDAGVKDLTLARTAPAFSVISLSVGIAALFLSLPFARALSYVILEIQAALVRRLAYCNELRNAEASRQANKNSRKVLDWPDVVGFLISENFNAIMTRAQRLEIVQSLKIDPTLDPTTARRQLRALIFVLYSISRAIAIAGARYDSVHQAEVSDDRPPLRKRIATFERTLFALKALDLLRAAVWFAAPSLVFLTLCLGAGVLQGPVAASQEGPRELLAAGLSAFDGFHAWRIDLLGWTVLLTGTLIIGVLMGLVLVAFLVSVFTDGRSYFLRWMASAGFFALAAAAVWVGYDISGGPVDVAFMTASSAAVTEVAHITDFVLAALRPGAPVVGYAGELSPAGYFWLRVAAAFGLSCIVLALFNLLAATMEFSGRKRSGLSLAVPSDLVQIAGAFVTFIAFSLLVYMAAIELANGGPKPPDQSGRLFGEIDNFIPYTVFLALVGAIMTVASRDLLENYFAGLAFRVDMPFEVGDRVFIDDGRLAEVRRIGIRTVELFEVQSNTMLSLTHRELSSREIHNATKTGFAYRRSVMVEVRAGGQDAACVDARGETVVAKLEQVLLVAGLCAAGVRRPALGRYRLLLDKPYALFLKAGRRFESETERTNAGFSHIPPPGRGRKLRIDVNGENFDNESRSYRTIDFKRYRDGVTAIEDEDWGALSDLNREQRASLFSRLIVDEVVAKFMEIEENFKSRAKGGASKNGRPAPRDRAAERVALLASDDPTYQLDMEKATVAISKQSEPRAEEVFAAVFGSIKQKIIQLIHLTGDFDAAVERAVGLTPTAFAPPTDPDAKAEDWEERAYAAEVDRFYDAFVQNGAQFAGEWPTLSRLAVEISEIYSQISLLMWRFRETDATAITDANRRDIDRASTQLLNPPRVSSERRLSETGTPFWRATLHVTVRTAEQSDEILHKINLMVATFWRVAGLDAVERRRGDLSDASEEAATAVVRGHPEADAAPPGEAPPPRDDHGPANRDDQKTDPGSAPPPEVDGGGD